jgi:hypothetical protein
MADIFQITKTWLVNRIKERTTWDGIVLIAAGVTYIVFKPIAAIMAYCAIVYGLWTLLKKEQE